MFMSWLIISDYTANDFCIRKVSMETAMGFSISWAALALTSIAKVKAQLIPQGKVTSHRDTHKTSHYDRPYSHLPR